jgi:hypothetical protein
MKKIRVDKILELLTTIEFRNVSFFLFCIRAKLLKYAGLKFYLLFCKVVKLGPSAYGKNTLRISE